jgi:hypothetical protein
VDHVTSVQMLRTKGVNPCRSNVSQSRQTKDWESKPSCGRGRCDHDRAAAALEPHEMVLETGRREYRRGKKNILKRILRILLHASGLNLGLVMRTVFGVGTPRGASGPRGRVVCRPAFARIAPQILAGTLRSLYRRQR